MAAVADTGHDPTGGSGDVTADDDQATTTTRDEPTADDRSAERERERDAERAREREKEREADRARARATRGQTVRWATTVVSVLSTLFAVALALHIVFVIFDANQANPLVTFAADLADGLVVFFRDLFTPEDDRVGVLVNYGMAAIFWLIVGRIVIALLRRIR